MSKNIAGRIGIIGHFAFGQEVLDGQTVKTKILYDGLLNYKDSNVDSKTKIYCVDTYDNKVNKFRLLLKSLICILSCKTIIILLSGNGMRIYFPMMYYAKKFLKRNVYHDVIGGSLALSVTNNPKYKKYLNSFNENWVEFQKMKKEMEEVGVLNCRVIPNFKHLNVKKAHLTIPEEKKSCFCMFSRVVEEKGITDAIIAIDQYNREHNADASLEIWGPVDDKYSEKFALFLEKYKSCVTYRGTVSYNKSIEVLTDHLALLFPTYWPGEGFPGTIVDAFAAGLPVIASEWKANSELIENFKTGLVYPNDSTKTLYESIEWAMNHQDKMSQMRLNCIENATEYITDKWIPFIIDVINK